MRSKNFQSGQTVIIALFFVFVLTVASGVLVTSVLLYSNHGRLAYANERALQLAEAGIDKAIYEINQTAGYTGEADAPLGGGTYTVTVTDASNKKIIESTGFVPDSASPRARKTVRVELKTSTTGASFVYGVQVGFGGLSMSNNAAVTGSVYSDGNIIGASNTAITGDAWVAGGVAPAPDQQQILQTGVQNVGDISSRADVAQSFKSADGGVISRVSLYLKKVGNPSNATIRIAPDNGGKPANTSLSSGTLTSSSVGSNFGWVDVSFSSPPALNGDQTYWLVFDMSSVNALRYYIWGKHDNSGYGNGVGKYSASWSASPSVWNDADGDMSFKTWMGAGNTRISSVRVGFDAHANTIQNSDVGRDAYYQSISGTAVAGTAYPGSADPPVLDMPLSESVIDDFRAAAAAGGTVTPPGGTYIVDGVNLVIGPKKIIGDLLLINGASLTLTGTLWVEGNITLDNNSQIRLDPGYGASSGVLLADYAPDPYLKGQISLLNNARFFGSGDPDSYIMVLSTYANPVNQAISISNNTVGAIFYASAGTVHLSNNVSAKEVIAYRLSLDNNASVIYESGLANVEFSSGPTGGWVLNRGSWQILSP